MMHFSFRPVGSVDETAALAREAEALGFDCLWIPDLGLREDPFVLGALCLRETRSICIGIGVTTPYTRHSGQIARAVGTLALIAPGRVRLGLGSANVAATLRPLGLRRERPVERLRDSVAMVRLLMTGRQVTYRGGTEGLYDAALEFPVPEVRVPIYIGARAPRMLELAGSVSDGVLLNSLCTPDTLRDGLRSIGRGAARAERVPESLDVVAGQLVSFDTGRGIPTEALVFAARSIAGASPAELEAIGIADRVVSRIRRALIASEYTELASVIDEELVNRVAVTGEADVIAERLRAIASVSGIRRLLALSIGSCEEITETMRAIAGSVFPALQEQATLRGT